MFPCSSCPKLFSLKRNLSRHVREVHREPAVATGRAQCAYCALSFRYHHDLMSHLKLCHSKDIDLHRLDFASEQEFTGWLAELEVKEGVHYVKRNVYPLKDGSEVSRWDCNCSGLMLTTDESSEDPQLITRTKISCTSRIMKQTQPNGAILLYWTSLHLGGEEEEEVTVVSLDDSTSEAQTEDSNCLKEKVLDQIDQLKHMVCSKSLQQEQLNQMTQLLSQALAAGEDRVPDPPLAAAVSEEHGYSCPDLGSVEIHLQLSATDS